MFDWYNLFNKQDFLDTNLISRTLDVFLEGVGQKQILITRGNELGVVYDDVFLIVGFNSKNPFEFEDRAIYTDANDDVWIGLAVDE